MDAQAALRAAAMDLRLYLASWTVPHSWISWVCWGRQTEDLHRIKVSACHPTSILRVALGGDAPGSTSGLLSRALGTEARVLLSAYGHLSCLGAESSRGAELQEGCDDFPP